ncbi:histone H3.v1-like [Pogonomyrmex barbatus]|uniref:Histone H3.v1-like n=1 Tax=Pogonomyrmex barbatus TaxID=144034 RepID=A0A6I9WDD5_9HYME|nr:histone H3.v1-like [Pogonomyrmex barbatus]
MRIDVQPEEEEGIPMVDLVSDVEENSDEEPTLSEADTEIYAPLQANDLDESEYGEEENEEEENEEEQEEEDIEKEKKMTITMTRKKTMAKKTGEEPLSKCATAF